MNRKTLLIGLTLLIVGAGIAVYFVMNRDKPSVPNSTNGGVTAKTGIKGSVLLGPACPGPQDARNAACGDKPYQTKLVVTTSDQAQVIKEFNSDDQGTFTVEVEPGEYAIRSAAASDIRPNCSSGTITVAANQLTNTTIYCDTGLR